MANAKRHKLHLDKTKTKTIESQVYFVCKDDQLRFDHEKLDAQNKKYTKGRLIYKFVIFLYLTRRPALV
jgi:hypothetical protein